MAHGFVKGNVVDEDALIAHAIEVIQADFGDRVSVSSKTKDLIKFGRNSDVSNATTGSTIMTFTGGEDHETYVSTNVINRIVSSSANDTEQVVVEGHTISGGVFTFVTQTITLQGQTETNLTTALARCTRIYNNDSTNLEGSVYAYQSGVTVTGGVPQDGTKTHCIITAGKNQSEKCSTTISNTDYWLVTKFTADVLEKTNVYADIELQIRRAGGVFRSVDVTSAASGNGSVEDQLPYLIIPKNADVRLVAVGSADSIDVAGSIHGILAEVV